jgi:hypothetical protein
MLRSTYLMTLPRSASDDFAVTMPSSDPEATAALGVTFFALILLRVSWSLPLQLSQLLSSSSDNFDVTCRLPSPAAGPLLDAAHGSWTVDTGRSRTEEEENRSTSADRVVMLRGGLVTATGGDMALLGALPTAQSTASTVFFSFVANLRDPMVVMNSQHLFKASIGPLQKGVEEFEL